MVERLFNDYNTNYYNNIDINNINIVNYNDNNYNNKNNKNNKNNNINLKHKLADLIFDIGKTIPDSVYKEMLDTVAKIN